MAPDQNNSPAEAIDLLDLSGGTGVLLLKGGRTYTSALGLGLNRAPGDAAAGPRRGARHPDLPPRRNALSRGRRAHPLGPRRVLRDRRRERPAATRCASCCWPWGRRIDHHAAGRCVGPVGQRASLRPLTGVSERHGPSPAANWPPAWSPRRRTRTWPVSPAPSTSWWTSSRSGSSVRLDSTPTSATSCAPRSPPSRRPSRCSRLTKRSSRPGPSRPSSCSGADLRRFQRMVADLLEISRSDAGSSDVVLEEVAVGELVRRAVRGRARAPCPGSSLRRVHVDPEVEGMHLRVDKRRFERVMANLLENAAFYGGGATRVVTHVGSRPARRAAHRRGVGGGQRARGARNRAGQGVRALLPGPRNRAGGAPGPAAASGSRWWPSTSGSTGGGCGPRRPTGGGARFVVQLPLDETDDERVDGDVP